MKMNFTTILAMMLGIFTTVLSAQSVVKIGLNYLETGPYSVQGLDQLRAAQLAVEEINDSGGIDGKNIELLTRDSQSKPSLAKTNVTDLIDNHGVKMVFGGSSSGVAIAAGGVCEEKDVLFFGTLTYSNATTGSAGLKHTFRECYNAWMGAEAIGDYLKANFAGKKYYYITADYTWGWTTEESVRAFTNTEDKNKHKGTKTPFPGATKDDFKKALSVAKMVKPDVLVLVLFGKDMAEAVRLATTMGLKTNSQIVVPNLTLGMADSGGPKVMEGVIGTLPWSWQVPYIYNYSKGKEFVENFSNKYQRYPSTSGASAYTILYEYKNAVERAKSFDHKKVIQALEGHTYVSLKDEQIWRVFDHQSIQTVFAVKCKPASAVLKDKYKLDYFEIINTISGENAARTRKEWEAARTTAGKPTYLEDL